MSIKKNNTYFQENDGKVYYYDSEGVKKDVPSTAFSNLQEQIDNLGSPLTYSGAQSVDELNELVDIKTGTVYTVTGNSGTLTAGGIDVQPSTEVAWAGEWFNIGKDLDNSWKQWSEDNNTTSIGFDNVYIGDYNNISGNVNYVIGRSNNANENSTDNTIIGNENTIKNENSNTILGRNNTISGNYTNTNTVIGNSNTASGTHNSFIIGENNSTIDQEGAGYSYVIGQQNTAGDDSVIIGTANSSQPGSFYKATLGWENKVGNSNNVVIGGNNSANENVGKTTIIAGYYNESSGGFTFGEKNKVNADSYAYGYNNSAMGGSTTFGKNNTGDLGARVFGDYNSANNGAAIFGNYGNIADQGSIVVGFSNYASNGGGVFGNGNINGKGGWSIGYQNKSRKYEIINPDNPSTSSIKYEDAPLGSLWSQNTFGFSNYTQFKKENGSYYHGMPFQIGSDNIVQDEITWNSDYDADTSRTYHNGGSYIGTFNIGTNNSAFDEGINIGYQNTILIGDSSGATINIGKNNVNRMGIIIGQRNVTYDTMTSISSTDSKSNAYSWILGQGNSANGASVAIGDSNKAQQGSYTFGAGLYANSGSMSIGIYGLYTEYASFGFGNSVTAQNGSIGIGRNRVYATYDGYAFGEFVTAQNGSIGIGRNRVYATDDGYAFGEFVTAQIGSIGIGRFVNATGHGYAFGYQITGASEGIAVGVNGVTASGQGAAFGFESVYSNGGSITLGHNGIYANATAVALGSNNLYSDYRSIAIGQFGVTATSAGLTIGSDNVYSTDNAIAIGKYGVGACGWGSFAIGIKGISADNTSWAIGYGGNAFDGQTTNYLSAHISATNESFSIGQSGISSVNNSFSIGRKHLFASDDSFVIGQKNLHAHDNSFMIGISGADWTIDESSITFDYDYGTWYNSFAIGRGRNVAHYNSFILGIHNNSNINLPYSADNNSIMMAVGDGLSSRTINDSVSIASYGLYENLTGKSTVEYQSLLLDHQVLGEVEVRNKSMMIGGPSFCQFHWDNEYSALSANVKEGSAKADHASIVLGYNNIADGGVFAIGSNNTACDIYSEYSGYTQYTQATIFGDYNRAINYRGTIYSGDVNYDLYNNGYDKNTQYTQESGFTRSLIVGTNNSLSGWNSFIFGINNSAGSAGYALGTYDSSDDGFTLVFGHSNYAVRNYDMAFGWKSFASGGENIAIGTPQSANNPNILYNTSAIGYKNIAIRSVVSGLNNIAVNSIVTGNVYSGAFDENILFDAIPNFNAINASNVRNNIFNNIHDSNYNISNMFDRNINSNVNYTRITSNFLADNIYHQVLSSNIITNQDYFNTYSNVISSNFTMPNVTHSFNLYKNITNTNLEVTYTASNNLLFDIGGSNNKFNYGIDLSVGSFVHNIIMNAGIAGSSVTGHGFCNNLIWKSYVNPYVATSRNESQIYYGDSITENILIGTEAFNVIQESFSFGTLDSNYVDPATAGSALKAPILKDVARIYNFGPNKIMHSNDTFVAGLSNEISGISKFTVLGTNNYVKSRQLDNYQYTNDVFHDGFIFGNCNAIVAYDDSYCGYSNTRNYVLGHTNSIVVNYKNPISDNADLTIIGGENHFAGLTNVMDSVITGTNNGGAYNWITNIYWSQTEKETTSYDSIIPIPQNVYEDGGYMAYSYSAFPMSGTSRSTIIGYHSVIGSNITDSTTIGTYNTIYQDEQPNDVKFSDINLIGSYNIGINGSHQFNAGFNNITSGHHSTAIGEELRANEYQTVLGKYNISADGTTRTTMVWNTATNRPEQIENTGVLLVVGNGRLNAFERLTKLGTESAYRWFDSNGNMINDKLLATDTYVQRSNAMIVSADGTVSARRFIESEPALTITGGDYVSVTEDTTNNKLVIDLESSLGQMLTELSGVLTAKPSTGRHILGVDGGTLTWLEVNQ